MMAQWTAWLDKLADEAVARDPKLRYPEAIREAVYRKKYGEDRWKAALEHISAESNRGFPILRS